MVRFLNFIFFIHSFLSLLPHQIFPSPQNLSEAEIQMVVRCLRWRMLCYASTEEVGAQHGLQTQL